MTLLSPLPLVSVIIPVLNDFDGLHSCLNALEQQSYAGEYEVLVIDNGSDQDIRPVVAGFPHVRVAFESQRSSYAARNRAIALAKGTIFAFTDADCVPALDWLEKGVESLAKLPNGGLVAGQVETIIQNTKKPTPVELYDLVFAFNQAAYIKNYKFGVTANLLAWKQTFDTVGLFDQALQSGGDYEWGWRVHQAGFALGYAPDACVAHPARDTFEALRKKTLRLLQGHHVLKQKGIYPPKRFVAAAIGDLVLPFRSIPMVLSHPRLHGFEQKIQTIGVMLRIRFIRGRERLRYLLQDAFGKNA